MYLSISLPDLFPLFFCLSVIFLSMVEVKKSSLVVKRYKGERDGRQQECTVVKCRFAIILSHSLSLPSPFSLSHPLILFNPYSRTLCQVSFDTEPRGRSFSRLPSLACDGASSAWQSLVSCRHSGCC